MKATETELFETRPVAGAIVRLAFPSVIGQIILVVYNMADTFFVGLTGSDAMIAAVTVCMPAFMFLSAISNLFGIGGASAIARALGRQDPQRARRAAGFDLWGCLAVTLGYSLGAWLLLDPFVNLLGGAAPELHGQACAYMIVTVVIGGVATSLNTLLSHLVRAQGRSVQASVGIAVGGLLNIALDPLFMFVILPSGQEVLGAGLATMLSNVCALIYFAVLLLRGRGELVIRLRPESDMFGGRIPREVLLSGIPACLMTLCENISYTVLDNLMSAAGTATQAGIGVAKKVNMLAHCIVRGMAQGVLPLIAYNYASGNRKRMKQTVYLSAGMSVAVSCVCMIACLLFSRELIGLFIQGGSASHGYGETFLRILCVGAPFSACAYMVISFFQATGQSLKSLILALLRKGLLDIPLMFFLNSALPVYGIVWATPIADILCCTASIALFLGFIRSPAVREINTAAEDLGGSAPLEEAGPPSNPPTPGTFPGHRPPSGKKMPKEKTLERPA